MDEVGQYGGEWGRRWRGRVGGYERERESKREDLEKCNGLYLWNELELEERLAL